jgi:hypothetical protein
MQLEKPYPSRGEIHGAGSPITGITGKWMDGGRASDGFVVAMNRLNRLGAKEPCGQQSSVKTGGKGEMIKRPDAGPRPAPTTETRSVIGLQDLRQRIYATAKAEPEKRFWGLFVHVCKLETLRTAYMQTKRNKGAPGIDGVTFRDIEQAGLEAFLEQIRDDLTTGRYMPSENRRKEIPKGNGKVRVLGIPTIRDRVVQGALKLILEPIFEADFQDGSYGYRPCCRARHLSPPAFKYSRQRFKGGDIWCST